MRNVKRTETDGGETEAQMAVEVTADVEITRLDWAKQFIDEAILAPVRIIWSDWRARVGTLIILLYLFMGTAATLLVETPHSNQGPAMLMPFQDLTHPLGTDGLGQDMLGLIVHATPNMLRMILAGGVFTVAMATVIGLFSGYKGGFFDRVMMTITDITMTIPGLPLIIVLAAILEPENPYLIGIVLTINAWAGLARALRSQVLTLRDEEYVEASRAMGIPTRTIVYEDILPNLMPYIMVNFVAAARGVIFGSVALYFLGILPFSNLNWGVTMNLAYETGGALYALQSAHWLFIPMGAVVLLSFGLILFSQGMDRVFNPRVRARHAKFTGGEDSEPPAGVSSTRTTSDKTQP